MTCMGMEMGGNVRQVGRGWTDMTGMTDGHEWT